MYVEKSEVDRRSTDWVFTLYDVREAKKLFLIENLQCRFLVFQEEACPTTKRKHYQGFVQFHTRKRGRTVQRAFRAPTMHVEVRRGSVADAIEYCSLDEWMDKPKGKVAGPWMKGTPTYGPKTTSQNRIVDLVKTGATDQEIFEAMPTVFLSSFNGLKRAKDLYRDYHFQKPKIFIYIGPTGSGKSRTVYQATDPRNRHLVNLWDKSFPFHGYENEENMVLDDFRGELPYGQLLQLLSGNPTPLNYKGGRRLNTTKNYYFTSSVPVTDWYSDRYECDDLYRRINEYGTVYNMAKDGTITVAPKLQYRLEINK